MRAGVPHRVLLLHRHFAAAPGLLFHPIFLCKGGMVNQILLAEEQLPHEIKPNGKKIVEWLAIRRVICLRSSFPSLCKLYEHKSLRREWFFCADFYIMLIKLCLQHYVNHRIKPPSTVSTCPVTKLASSLAR